MSNENLLEISAKGAVAGLVGTAALTVFTSYSPKLLQQFGVDLPESYVRKQAESPDRLAARIADDTFNTDLDQDERAAAGQALHWLYGVGWGAFYGVAQSKLRLPHLLHGTVFGLLIAALAATVIPAMRLTPPPSEQKPEFVGMQAVSCLLYGWFTALVFHRLSRSGRR